MALIEKISRQSSKQSRIGNLKTPGMRKWRKQAKRTWRLLGQCLFEGIRVNAKHQTPRALAAPTAEKRFLYYFSDYSVRQPLVAEPSLCARQQSQWTPSPFLMYLPTRREPRWLSRYSDSVRAGLSGDRIPMGDEIFRTCPDWPCGPPSLLYSGYMFFPGG